MNDYAPLTFPQGPVAGGMMVPPGSTPRHHEAEDYFWQCVGEASAAIATEAFYDRLLDILGSIIDVDLLALVRYSSFGAPNLVIPRVVEEGVGGPYNAGLYTLDPFYRYWQSVAQPTVATLKQLAGDDLWDSQYAHQVLQAAGISDEMAIFLPALGGASPTLLLDRASGFFTEAELAQVRAVFPVVAGLHQAHLRAITSHGLNLHIQDKPVRIVDRCGRELSSNQAWRDLLSAEETGLAQAVTCLIETGSTQAPLHGGRMLVRYPLGAGFGAAPDGFFEEVEPATASRQPASAYTWLDPLTQRERQIVLLTLEGHPIASIAKRLGLTQGTVKNHRMRLYSKLDITTERELFLTHMRHMQDSAA